MTSKLPENAELRIVPFNPKIDGLSQSPRGAIPLAIPDQFSDRGFFSFELEKVIRESTVGGARLFDQIRFELIDLSTDQVVDELTVHRGNLIPNRGLAPIVWPLVSVFPNDANLWWPLSRQVETARSATW